MKILDVCCGSKMFWYDKHEEHTTYMDIRRAVYTAMDRGNKRKIEINPDIQADWKNIPFDDETFDLVICYSNGTKIRYRLKKYSKRLASNQY